MPRSDDIEGTDLQLRVDGYASSISAIDGAQAIIDAIVESDGGISPEDLTRTNLEQYAELAIFSQYSFEEHGVPARRAAACDLIEELELSNIADAGSVAGAWLPEYSNKFITHTYLGHPDSLSVDGMELLVAGGGPNIFVEYGEYGESCFKVEGYWGGDEAAANCVSDCLGAFLDDLMVYEQERLTERSQSYSL
jgi:hypothetical protein